MTLGGNQIGLLSMNRQEATKRNKKMVTWFMADALPISEANFNRLAQLYSMEADELVEYLIEYSATNSHIQEPLDYYIGWTIEANEAWDMYIYYTPCEEIRDTPIPDNVDQSFVKAFKAGNEWECRIMEALI